MKQRDLSGSRRRSRAEFPREPTGTKSRRTGVRGAIVATKPGNAGGAKGSREMECSLGRNETILDLNACGLPAGSIHGCRSRMAKPTEIPVEEHCRGTCPQEKARSQGEGSFE